MYHALGTVESEQVFGLLDRGWNPVQVWLCLKGLWLSRLLNRRLSARLELAAMLRILCLILWLTRFGWGQPIFLPAGAEGLDLKSYDVKNRAPGLKTDQGVATIRVPLSRPEKLPRALQRAEFRSVGPAELSVIQDQQARKLYCPSRLINALKMDEWLSGTPIVMGVYSGYEGKPAVVSLMAESLNEKSLPASWMQLSKPEVPELILRSPLGDSFVCLMPMGQERVLFAGQPGQSSSEEGVTVYQSADSDWRVAVSRKGEFLRVLVAPVQDFPVLLDSLKSFFL